MSGSPVRDSRLFPRQALSFSPPKALNNNRGFYIFVETETNGVSKPPIVQTPPMRAPFGISTFTDDSGTEKHSIALSFEGSLDRVHDFFELCEFLDCKIIDHCHTYAWDVWPQAKAARKSISRESIKDRYYSLIKPPTDHSYPATTRVKIQERYGSLPSFWSVKRERCNMEDVPRGSTVQCLLELAPVFVNQQMISACWRLVQLLIKETPHDTAQIRYTPSDLAIEEDQFD